MTKYLLYNSRLVRPEMEKPKRRNDYLDHYFEYLNAMSEYRKHLSTLPGIECSEELLAKFKDGQELIEGKDFATEPRPVCHGRHSTMELIAVPVQSDEENWSKGMKAVQDDIDSVVKGAIVDKSKLIYQFDFTELRQVLSNAYAVLSGYSQDDTWSEWDESVKKSVYDMQVKIEHL